jgi:hypothetical protein
MGAEVPGFNASYQHDRGALALLQGTLYIPYAGLNGDCDPMGGYYHGYVVGIDTTNESVMSWSTSAGQGGIWGAIATDGVSSVFAVTGNTKGAGKWSGGEAILRFTQGPTFSGATTDYFAPSNWSTLDSGDLDLGSEPALLFDVPGATPSTLAVVGGKAGVLILVNRVALEGIGTGNGTTGEGLFSLRLTSDQLKGTPASYTTAKGRYVVVHATGAMTACPNGGSGDTMALRVTATSPPTLVPAWCANSLGQGSPIATTTDGTSNALVWIVSAQATDQLLAFDGDTGAAVFASPSGQMQLGAVLHWINPIVAKATIYVGGTGAVYAFKGN